MDTITELPQVVAVEGQPCQQLYEQNPVLLGYDVVEYHYIKPHKEGGVAVRGKRKYAYNFMGYQFWFSSERNLYLFQDNPWKYAPAWGGFCSWGIALELPPKWPWQDDFLGPPASPWTGWLIVDGVLMFNIWDSYSDKFMKDVDNNMKLAAERWKGWFGDLHAGPFNTHCIGHGPLINWCMRQQPSPWKKDLPKCGGSDAQQEDGTFVEIGSAVAEEDAVDVIVNGKVDNSGGASTTTNTTTTSSGGAGDSSPSVVGSSSNTGGGIVGEARQYTDFPNNKYSLSPYHTNVIIITASVVAAGILLILCTMWCLYKKRRHGKSQQDTDIDDFIDPQDLDHNTPLGGRRNEEESDEDENENEGNFVQATKATSHNPSAITEKNDGNGEEEQDMINEDNTENDVTEVVI